MFPAKAFVVLLSDFMDKKAVTREAIRYLVRSPSSTFYVIQNIVAKKRLSPRIVGDLRPGRHRGTEDVAEINRQCTLAQALQTEIWPLFEQDFYEFCNAARR